MKQDNRFLIITVVAMFSIQWLPVSVAQNLEELAPLTPEIEVEQTDNTDPPPFLEGAITNLTVVRGRSQLVKFAQPVKRVSIADPGVADVVALNPKELLINGLARGVTSLVVWDDLDQEGIFDLSVVNDTSEVEKAIKVVAPNEAVQIQVTDDSLILTGTVSNSVILDEIRQIAYGYGYRDDTFINLTETPQTQVALKVRIMQMNRGVAREFKSAISATQVNSERIYSFNRLLAPFVDGDAFPVDANANNVGGFTSAVVLGNTLNFGFEFLETEGKISTLAEPELITTHGRPASFLAGGEFPFISAVNQNGAIQITFKEFGVKLDFVPWVDIRSGLVELQIAPEVSSIDNSSCVDTSAGTDTSTLVCGIQKRRTETTVQLNDGEGLMISGILTREENDLFRKVPFIGDIPILGRLFTNSETDHQDTELIVTVIPTIIHKNASPNYTYPPRGTGPRKISVHSTAEDAQP